jgi:hypothetical protein
MKALLFGLSSLDTTDQKHGGPSTYGKQWDVLSLEKLPFYAIPLFALLVCLTSSFNPTLTECHLLLDGVCHIRRFGFQF